MAINNWHTTGKGTKRRPEDKDAIEKNWDRIFPPKEKK
jgi:hypothetical protein